MDISASTDSEGTRALVASRRRAVVRLRVIVGLLVALPALGYLGAVAYLYERAFADAAVSLDRTVRIAREHALRLFDTNQMLLQRMLDLVGDRSDEHLLDDGAELHRRLAEMAATLPQVQGLFVNGADARMIASSRVYPPRRDIDYKDRDWYQAHAQGAQGTYVTPQFVSRATGEGAFDMSRRRDVRGRFAGTVNVSLRPEYLTDFYRELAAFEPGLHVLVLRSDGGLVAHWPSSPSVGKVVPANDPTMRQIAAGATSGAGTALSPFDSVKRLRSFQRLGGYPLYVIAALDHADILSAWRRQAALLALVVVPLAAGLVGFAWQAMRRAHAELDAVLRLDAETARRRRAEIALLQSQKLEAMGRLTGGVAHDFNNLLAVVSSNVEVLRRLHPELTSARQIEAIARAVASGVKLTRQLLAFARKQALLPEHVELQDRLPGLVDLLRPLLGASVVIETNVDPATWPISVDPAELELALINLAVNAGDAMHGAGRLTIHAHNTVDEDMAPGAARDFVAIDVDDTGPGIDPGTAEQVFEPFFTTKPIGHGTGLGLSQVRAFCQTAGGDAHVARTPTGGARIRMFLRRSSAPPSAAAPIEDSVLPELDLRVLLVEDNDEVAASTSQLLETMGAQVHRVVDAGQALQFVATHREEFDVVLSDIEMPGGLDGIALAERLTDLTPSVPVVLITGYARHLELALRQGLSVLPKPCLPVVLADALHRATGRLSGAATPRSV